MRIQLTIYLIAFFLLIITPALAKSLRTKQCQNRGFVDDCSECCPFVGSTPVNCVGNRRDGYECQLERSPGRDPTKGNPR